MKIRTIVRLLSLQMGGMSILPYAHAATVVSAQAANADHPPTPSSYPSFWTDNFSTANDLLLGLTPAMVGNFGAYSNMNATTVNDGSLTAMPTSNAGDLSFLASVGPGAGTRLTFTLAQASLVSSIKYFGGWTDDGRSDINFTVSYSTDNGNSYTPLIDPTGGIYSTLGDEAADTQIGGMNSGGTTTFTRTLGGGAPVTNYVNVTDDSTAYLGNNAQITNLRFDFGDVRNGWAGLEELTVTGMAVPEPGTFALGLGGFSLLLLRRRGSMTKG